MLYYSTRDRENSVDSSTAITRGLSSDGGLFIPQEFPEISQDELLSIKQLSYQETAKLIVGKYLTDFSDKEIEEIVDVAYNKFSNKEVVPVTKLDDSLFVAELWHGPTSAFKDVALQLLPHLMVASKDKCGVKEDILILVATSGDTGKAALEGFKDVEGTKVVVYYPDNGVSDIQYMQMATQEGKNTEVIAVNGNFDDAQSGVKDIFINSENAEMLDKDGFKLSSANSINWGRLLPQIVYYFTSYAKVSTLQEMRERVPVDFVVPTGNFGNILAGYYAKKMGLPVGKLICASNSNKVLYDFMKTGEYDINRELVKTISPSMDIIISSNFERLLYAVSGNDTEFIKDIQRQLKSNGSFKVGNNIMDIINSEFESGWANDVDTKSYIRKVWENYNYLIDPHTAIAFSVLDDVEDSGNKKVVLSTANPYKFTGSVLEALTGNCTGEGFEDMESLRSLTENETPKQLSSLKGKYILHTSKCEKNEMFKALQTVLK
jgi:threonine synthase